MRTRVFLLWLIIAFSVAGISYGVDKIEILIDQSEAMWKPLGSTHPRFIALRIALDAVVLSIDPSEKMAETGIRTIAGSYDRNQPGNCADTQLLHPIGTIDPQKLTGLLSDQVPRGSRSLVGSVVEAAGDLVDPKSERRIVLITAGNEECYKKPDEAIAALGGEQSSIELRIIGLQLNQETTVAFNSVAPTRNVTDTQALVDALRWAILPPEKYTVEKLWLEIRLMGSGGLDDKAELRLQNEIGGDPIIATAKDGTARIKAAPGRYHTMLNLPDGSILELPSIEFGPGRKSFEFDISPFTPVTLEIDPQSPVAGGTAHVQFWGASEGMNWVYLVARDAHLGEHLHRAPVTGTVGEIGFRLLGPPQPLDAIFVHQLEEGVFQVLGRIPFETAQADASLDTPEKVENRVPFEIGWTGPNFPGDHITLGRDTSEPSENEACVFLYSTNLISLVSPEVPGKYAIKYQTATGRVLAQANLEVFQVLATIEAPTSVSPGEEFTVNWTGPESDQDYLSITTSDAPEDDYLHWSPTRLGNPARLRAPKKIGEYELRYVRSADSTVLARHTISVVTTPIELEVPKGVEAGARFEVKWSGTPSLGDYLTVAPPKSPIRRRLDWATVDSRNTLTLAAPFKSGTYEVRYISGQDGSILASCPLTVQ